METIFQDIKFALRVFRKSPAFAVVVVLTLALGIGANTATFSIVHGVLLHPLPFRDPGALQKVTFNNPGVGLRNVPFSVPEFEDLKARAGVFEDVSVVWPVSVNLTGAKEPQRLELMVVSPNYFSMLGATPQIGRLFGSQDFALGFLRQPLSATGFGAGVSARIQISWATASGWTMISTPSSVCFLPIFVIPEKRSPGMSRCGAPPDIARILSPRPPAISGSCPEQSLVLNPASPCVKPKRAWIPCPASCDRSFPRIILPRPNGRSQLSRCSSLSSEMSAP